MVVDPGGEWDEGRVGGVVVVGGAGNEISAFPSVIADCACRGVGYTIRPLIGNQNWGGVEGSCTKNQTLDNQTLQIILEKKNE